MKIWVAGNHDGILKRWFDGVGPDQGISIEFIRWIWVKIIPDNGILYEINPHNSRQCERFREFRDWYIAQKGWSWDQL